jgi:hypothetical protein
VTEAAWHILTVVLAVAVVVEAMALVATLRHLGSIMLRVGPDTYGDVEEGPQVGTIVDPSVVAGPGLVLFVSQTCSLCKPLVARLPSIRRSFPLVTIVAAAIGEPGPQKDRFAESLGRGARSDLDGLYQSWAVPGTPFGVAVGRDGVIAARGVVNSVSQLETLIDPILSSTSGPRDSLPMVATLTGEQRLPNGEISTQGGPK